MQKEQAIDESGKSGKRDNARDLIIIDGFSQKKAARAVGVSQMTICRWIRKYKWKKYKRKNRTNNPPHVRINKAIEAKKRKAGDLIVIYGFDQKKTAITVGVSQMTICRWIRKYKWKNRSNNPLTRINKARYLVVNRGYFKRRAALIIGVNEKTVYAWARKYKWQNARNKVVEKHLSFETFVEYFLIYVSYKDPKIHKWVQRLWDEYAIELRHNIGMSNHI